VHPEKPERRGKGPMIIDSILKSVDMIPAFPAAVQKVAGLLRHEDYMVADVVNVIKHDQAIAANILKISNSAYFGARQKIKTIHDAVVYLGQQQLIRAVQTAGVSKIYQKGGKGSASQAKDFWEHAVAVALMSQILCRKIQGREDPILYTAALLHDVGKVIMEEHVHEYFQKIIGRVDERKCSFLEAEEEVIGINHANLGGRIAEHWNFPPEIRDAIAYHHRPDLLEEAGNTNASLIYLSDHACRTMGLTGGVDVLACTGMEDVMRHFDLDAADLEKSFIVLLDELEKAKDLMHIG
jgi:putative nucleotidyltransferase with HDIG domain